jgi:hypothetical protein
MNKATEALNELLTAKDAYRKAEEIHSAATQRLAHAIEVEEKAAREYFAELGSKKEFESEMAEVIWLTLDARFNGEKAMCPFLYEKQPPIVL